MANNAAGLNAILDLALRDTADETWTSAEKDASIARAVRNLAPKVVRPLDPASYTSTLVASTYTYTLNSAIAFLSAVWLVQSDATERGPLSAGTWTVEGDALLGTAKVRISPSVVDRWAGGTVRYVGYGYYDVTTNLIPDDYVDLVISTAATDCLKALVADRSRFLQQGNTRQDQVVSINEMVQLLNAFEQSAREKKAATTTFRRPVPGRV